MNFVDSTQFPAEMRVLCLNAAIPSSESITMLTSEDLNLTEDPTTGNLTLKSSEELQQDRKELRVLGRQISNIAFTCRVFSESCKEPLSTLKESHTRKGIYVAILLPNDIMHEALSTSAQPYAFSLHPIVSIFTRVDFDRHYPAGFYNHRPTDYYEVLSQYPIFDIERPGVNPPPLGPEIFAGKTQSIGMGLTQEYELFFSILVHDSKADNQEGSPSTSVVTFFPDNVACSRWYSTPRRIDLANRDDCPWDHFCDFMSPLTTSVQSYFSAYGNNIPMDDSLWDHVTTVINGTHPRYKLATPPPAQQPAPKDTP